MIQSMPDVSPTRWHLGHTTWFFETFVAARALSGYEPYAPEYEYLFNSYYNTIGAQFPRAERGLLSRPTVSEILDYRRAIDERILELLSSGDERLTDDLRDLICLGVHHEQQHQELMLTDIKHVFSCNPLAPRYRQPAAAAVACPDLEWAEHGEGIEWIGHGGDGFAFDNERPRHRVFLQPWQLATRLVTNGEYREFMDDGGYSRPELWLSQGWATVNECDWCSPLYWQRTGKNWQQFTMAGLRPCVAEEPVCHVSFFEADAYARWAGARLPTEAEWEVVARSEPIQGNFVDSGVFHPAPAPIDTDSAAPQQLFGDVWEWTASPYLAYPGYRPAPGAIGEYNGKFMCNQFVLRGGSCATSGSHLRPTYRNFFPPDARWQFSGIRLAQ